LIGVEILKIDGAALETSMKNTSYETRFH
jgi:hypothetical protein